MFKIVLGDYEVFQILSNHVHPSTHFGQEFITIIVKRQMAFCIKNTPNEFK